MLKKLIQINKQTNNGWVAWSIISNADNHAKLPSLPIKISNGNLFWGWCAK